MPYRIYIKILLSILIIALATGGYGQEAYKKSNNKLSNNWQINYNIGFAQFYGDASNNGYFKKFSGEISFATGVTARKYFNPIFGLGLNLWYSGIKSHKEKSATGSPLNFYLIGGYFDGNLNLLIDFNNLFWGSYNRKFSTYGIVGIGYGSWNNQLTNSTSGWVTNSSDAAFKKAGIVIPVGAGLNYMIVDNLAINFEMNLRTILNDDLDVWRGGFKYDQLLYTSFGVSYFINSKTNPKKPKSNYQNANKKIVREVPLSPTVSVYNYSLQSQNKPSVSSGSDTILINTPPAIKPNTSSAGVVFRVQILAVRNNLPSINTLKNQFNIVGDIFENYQDGIHRYSTGTFLTYRDALRHSYLMKGKGVHDAFVVAYKNDIRIPISPEMKKQ